MSARHRKPTATSRAVRTAARTGATVVIGGIAMFGATTGVASATTAPHPAPSIDQESPEIGSKVAGPSNSNSLVDVSHNNIPVQVCHNQIPVNVLGVQVPVKDVTAGLGLGLLGSEGEAPASKDSSCRLPNAQQN